jgi:hypothetical protein
MATIAVTMMSLRISYHPCIVMSCAIALAHRALRQREALHTGAKFYSETCRLEPSSIPSDLAMVASPAEPTDTNNSKGLNWRTSPIAHIGIKNKFSGLANQQPPPGNEGRRGRTRQRAAWAHAMMEEEFSSFRGGRRVLSLAKPLLVFRTPIAHSIRFGSHSQPPNGHPRVIPGAGSQTEGHR